MHFDLDITDRQLLNALQAGVPLVARPFAAIGNALGLDEDDVLLRIRRLKADFADEPDDADRDARNGQKSGGLIRQISAIFDSRALGYQTTLVAARVDPEKLDQAAAIISRHPGVSHNYSRDHAFNLWYTLAVPGDSALGLEATANLLHNLSGALSTRLLPTIRVFKIGVKLDMTGEGEIPGGKWKIEKGGMAAGVSESDKIMIRILQQDLPLVGEPFSQWARQAGVSEAELLAAACDFRERGVMRRFAAVLHHRQAGFAANAMGVWVVALDEAETFGNAAATFPAVSHCYLRKSYPDWPYTMFTMIHGTSRQKCETSMAEIAAATGIQDYAALYSTKEYKKNAVEIFHARYRGVGKVARMIAVVQRVSRAQVTVEGRFVGRIAAGILVLAAVETEDTQDDGEWMAAKLLSLRIFRNAEKHFDLDVTQLGPGAGVLLVSNFTVAAETSKGRRPSLSNAAPPERGRVVFDQLVETVRRLAAGRVAVETGEFGAMMDVELVNDGPVTFIVESERHGP